jgi:glycosyltransferase involved in cell wall biosynthesis
MSNSKKILFIDAALHKKDATGITLSNLFAFWPKENLFMIGPQGNIQLSQNEGYKNTYVLDNKDYYHRFPLGFVLNIWKLLKKKVSVSKSKETSDIKLKYVNTVDRTDKFSMSSSFFLLFQWLGLDHLIFRQVISSELREWIVKSDPDYFYAVLSTRHSIIFAEELKKEFNKPFIIHILDDWPAAIGNNSIFKNYWNKKINQEFKQLINTVSKRVAISEAMAKEFELRFSGKWDYFHNPIDINQWLPYQKKTISKHSDFIKIAYFGRIGRANQEALLLFIDAIKELNKIHLVFIQIDIYSSNILPNAYLELDFIKIHGFINHHEIPKIIVSYDYLILPISFNEQDFTFSRLSIPTKLSEYLISGVPVIIFAPKETAVCKFADETNSAFVISTTAKTEIVASLGLFFSDEKMQKEISENARMVANQYFSIEIINKKFNNLFP